MRDSSLGPVPRSELRPILPCVWDAGTDDAWDMTESYFNSSPRGIDWFKRWLVNGKQSFPVPPALFFLDSNQLIIIDTASFMPDPIALISILGSSCINAWWYIFDIDA